MFDYHCIARFQRHLPTDAGKQVVHELISLSHLYYCNGLFHSISNCDITDIRTAACSVYGCKLILGRDNIRQLCVFIIVIMYSFTSGCSMLAWIRRGSPMGRSPPLRSILLEIAAYTHSHKVTSHNLPPCLPGPTSTIPTSYIEFSRPLHSVIILLI